MSKARTTRTASYSIEEDQLLSRVYLDVSQDKAIGKYQAYEQFWNRVMDQYHELLPPHVRNTRPLRSLQTRMANILTAISKLRGCVRQIENLNPSGASEQDILDRAKALLAQDSSFKKGFRFDHVWPILKDIEKFRATPSREPSIGSRKRLSDIEDSESEADRTDKSIGSSSFCVNLNDDFETQGPSNERPTGRKKEKMKNKQLEECHQFFEKVKAQNERIEAMFQESQATLQRNYEVQLAKVQFEAKKVELAEFQEESKIMTIDVDSITDPIRRDWIRNAQLKIHAKGINRQSFGGVESSGQFNQYFDNLGGSGSDLGDY